MTDTLLLGANEALVVPTAGGGARTFDLRDVLSAETRLPEVEFANRAKGGMLLDLFNRAMLSTRKVAGVLLAMKNDAKLELGRVKGSIILETVPEYLKKTGGAARSPYGSEDIREAIIATQETYQKALSTLNQIEAAEIWLNDYFNAFKNAYFAVQTLCKEFEPSNHV